MVRKQTVPAESFIDHTSNRRSCHPHYSRKNGRQKWLDTIIISIMSQEVVPLDDYDQGQRRDMTLHPDNTALRREYMHMGVPEMEPLVAALLDGDHSAAVTETRKLRQEGVSRERIVTEGVEVAMGQLDEKCTVEQFNLLEIMLAGRAVMGVIRELYPPGDPPQTTRGTVLVAALEGDVHDLGKNVLKSVLTARRFRVVDCGMDCPAGKLIECAEREGALAVSISGLITTVIPQVRALREALRQRGMGDVRLVAGGAALKQASAESLNVDFVADSAFDALHFLERLTGD